ncbi:unnamed protein product [Meganyctiphanes norvegica]|uniref:Neurotransmitter-gated ion-channel transmembrane domain-containing protein n=1 Tax=Meganyctiphanes norvegica TaxID=48144 RepID=A0AAV2Q4U4_MEGNR
MDALATTWISMNGPPTLGDISQPQEIELYSGWENSLSISRKYGKTFQCHFDLAGYPFDTQTCSMELTMLSASSNLVTFDEVQSTVTFVGRTSLVEYIVKGVNITVNNTLDYSVMYVTVYLSRLSGFIMLTVYTPSAMLLVISYLTLFFRVELFQDRIMATITALLVTATIFSQAASSLPKTSYVKMLDVWLLFCIMLMVTIVFLHTIIDFLHNKRNNRIGQRVNVKSQIDLLNPLGRNACDWMVLGSRIGIPIFTLFFLIIYCIVALL